MVPDAWAGWTTVLTPREGQCVVGDSVWVVVRAKRKVDVQVDGKPVGAAQELAPGLYHLRASGIRPEGSVVEVRVGSETIKVRVGRVVPGEVPSTVGCFHAKPVQACEECHPVRTGGCLGCHTFGGHKHIRFMEKRCDLCHVGGALPAKDVVAACSSCHREYSNAKHPNLRHSASAPRDPRRPGRRLDCTSCHDAHAPVKLSRYTRAQLQEWCKGCHATP
jgi:predicted CXXCH cytochrome family protein